MADEIIHRKKAAPVRQKRQENGKYTQNLTAEQAPKTNLWHILIIAIITLAVFSPALKNNFTNWDDQAYVQHNPLIKEFSWHTVKEIFFSKDLHKRYWMGNYHPLTMLSLNLSYQLSPKKDGQPQAWIFILTNILLHLINSILVYIFIVKLARSDKIAFIAALLFAVHTLHVESVAWIAERKDVLYSLFYIWSLIEYVKFVDSRKWSHYFWSFLLFFTALLSKGQAVSLALSIYLIDILRRRKWYSSEVLLEKLPYFILALIFGLVAITAQKYSLAITESTTYALYKRIGIASYGFAMYILKLILPIHLSALYPYPDIIHRTIPNYYYLFIVPDLLLVSLIFYWIKKKADLAAFGLSFFIANIIFLLQLIPVGSAIYADRYAYIPSIGWFLLVGYFLSKIKSQSILWSVVGLYVSLLSFLTVQRIKVWQNSLTLWEDTIQKTPKAVVAWNNLGSVLSDKALKYQDKGKLEKAQTLYISSIDKFTNAIKGKPDYANAFYNRSVAEYHLFLITNDSSYIYKALEDVNKAIVVKLDFKDAFIQRGLLYDLIGEHKKAAIDYERVIELDPQNARAYANLGTYYGQLGQYQKALEYFRQSIKYNPKLFAGYSNIGLVYLHLNKLDSALYYLKIALKHNPDAITYFNLSVVYNRRNDLDKAIEYMQKAYKLSPSDPIILYSLAGLYLRKKQLNKACKFFKLSAAKNYSLARKAVQLYCKQKK